MRINRQRGRALSPQVASATLSIPNRYANRFPLPFDVLLIFSTNLQPEDLMDAAFLRRIRYKVKLHSPTRDEYREIFEAVAKSHGLGLTDEIFEFVIDSLNGRVDLAYYQPGFICAQV